MRKFVACLVMLWAVVGFALAEDTTPAFTFTTIDPPDSVFTFPFGINPGGDIVGNYVAGGRNHGF